MKIKTFILIILLGLLTSNSLSQTTPPTKKVEITDKNFKSYVSKGFVVIKFTSSWSENKDLDSILKKAKGYQGAVIIEVSSKETRKVIKKLRIRNYPSVALFHNGSKKKVWKGDMDGKLDMTIKDLTGEIDDILAGDVF
ncbi:hypothetical protein H8D04_01565 [bacterium]|nr:hypothetical protein [bacterium]